MTKILILDDNALNRSMLANRILTILPVVSISQEGETSDALKLIREFAFDIIFIDISLTNKNGFEFIDQVRNCRQEACIVLLSEVKDFEYARKGIDVGVLGYLLKPYDNVDLQYIIRKYLDITLKRDRSETLLLYTYNGSYPVDVNSLIAIEKAGRNRLLVYTRENALKDIKGTLIHISSYLPSKFIYINRQCIINVDAIEHFNPKTRQVFLGFPEKEICFICSRWNMKHLLDNFAVKKS